MEISSIIRMLRKDNKLTQRQLSDISNISLRALSYYENGFRNPPEDVLLKLSQIFNVDIDDLKSGKCLKIEKDIYTQLLTLKNVEDTEGTVRLNRVLKWIQAQRGEIKDVSVKTDVRDNSLNYTVDTYRFITIIYYSNEELRLD